jgi:hypothetical protein
MSRPMTAQHVARKPRDTGAGLMGQVQIGLLHPVEMGAAVGSGARPLYLSGPRTALSAPAAQLASHPGVSDT